MHASDEPLLSLVIPLHDEEENAAPLCREMDAALVPLGIPYEVILVNDASTDGTRAAMEAIASVNPHVRALHLKRQAGQTAALAAGFSRARGKYVATLDGDLQNDPADLPMLLRTLEESGADAVLGYRRSREDGWWRLVQSRIGNAARRAVTGDDARDTGCSLKIFRREALLRLPMFRNMHRFFPALLLMEGFRYVQVPVRHRDRAGGRTKYHLWGRLTAGIADLFALAWMKKRRLNYEIEETRP